VPVADRSRGVVIAKSLDALERFRRSTKKPTESGRHRLNVNLKVVG
jgi:hypothetical protein